MIYFIPFIFFFFKSKALFLSFVITLLKNSLTSTSFSLQMIEATDWIIYQEKGQKIECAENLAEGVYSELFFNNSRNISIYNSLFNYKNTRLHH